MSRRPRWLVLSGAGLVLVGLGLLGYVGWQLWGTTWQSHRVQRDLVSGLRDAWASDSSTAQLGDVEGAAIVRIPAFGPDYEVPVVQGTDATALASGLGQFTGSADPGEPGNLALAGHRVTHGEPLRAMPDLVAGDVVEVETREAVFTYVLTTGGEELEVPFTQTWVVDPRPVNPDPTGPAPDPDQDRLLTLTTCAELFHTDDRLVVFGVLESVDRASR